MREKCPSKHLVFVLNKCDLVPTWATARWIGLLGKTAPTLAFHAHLTRPFGKGNLINLLRQLAALHPEKKQISVGFVGYPNVGKSSVINALRSKKVCKTAPTPGETKVWQYVTLFKRVYLIDSPGTVPGGTRDSPSQLVLKGVTRVSALADPASHVAAVLQRARREHVARTYGLREWADVTDFLEQLARRQGRLLKGGAPDTGTAARGVLVDWQSGRLPFFEAPPLAADARAPRDQPLDELRVDPALADEPEQPYLAKQQQEQMREHAEEDQEDAEDLEKLVAFDDLIE